MPTFSPDGSKIAFESAGYFGDHWYNGIAVANADGTGTPVQLTGAPDPTCNGSFDRRLAFTNDGSKIAFTHQCNPPGGGINETVYVMNADGSDPVQLHGLPGIDGAISCQPRARADRILLSSNVEYWGSNLFDMYSVMPDGSQITRLTNNSVYDGLARWWMSNYASSDDRKSLRTDPIQLRMDHLKRSQQERRAR